MLNRLTRIPARLSRRGLLVPLALAVSVALSACGGAASPSPVAAVPTLAPSAKPAAPASSPVAAPAASPAASTTGSPVASPAASPTAAASTSQKVDANSASQDQIQQALEAAEVPNAARWTREVMEYRPYPTNDPSFAKLRQELAKYNPSADVVDKIVSALTL
jgi:hypothetical protein